MRERMIHLGGTLEIENRPSSGTVVTVRVTDTGRMDTKNGQSYA